MRILHFLLPALTFAGTVDTKAVTATAEEQEDREQQILDVLEGIVAGSLDSEIPDLKPCVNDILRDVGTDMMDAVTQLDDPDLDWTMAKISVEEIGQSFLSLADNMVEQDCGLAEQEVEKLRTMGANFADPTTFAYHVGKDLWINGVSIYDDIQDAITDYHSELWFNMGYSVGSAVALTILGDADVPEVKQGQVRFEIE